MTPVMEFGDLSGRLRKWQDEARRAREEDAPARALRLAPESVAQNRDLLRKAEARLGPGKRPCDYRPWSAALVEAEGRIAPLDLARDPYAHHQANIGFRAFMEDVALPAWPEPRRDLIEFALAFLEADVMLFRSGYAKRHMIRRLQQSPLTEADIARIDALLHRAVTQGTGLEVYRAFCKLAAHLVAEGHLGDLPGWLAARAEGAILTLGMAGGRLWQQILSVGLTDADLASLSSGGWVRPYRNGVAWPEMGTVVPAGFAVKTDAQKLKRNAWRMLDHILRRAPDMLHDSPA